MQSMKPTIIAPLAALALATGCTARSGESAARSTPKPTSGQDTPAVAALPSCSTTWTLAEKITTTQAGADCRGADGRTFHPEMLVCDPAAHEGVAVTLFLGPDARYAVFVEPHTTSEVDDGTGTGDYRDDQTAAQEQAYCAAK